MWGGFRRFQKKISETQEERKKSYSVQLREKYPARRTLKKKKVPKLGKILEQPLSADLMTCSRMSRPRLS